VSHSGEFYRHNPLCCFSKSVYSCCYCYCYCYFLIDSVRNLFDTTSHTHTHTHGRTDGRQQVYQQPVLAILTNNIYEQR